MEDSKKITSYRLIAILLLLVPLAISIWFMIRYIQIDAKSFGLHIFTSCVLIVFIGLQIFLLLKNMKKPLVIHMIAFNENKTVNKTALIFVSVGCGIGLILSIVFGVLAIQAPSDDPFRVTAMMLIFSIFLYLLINTLMFIIYTIIFREKKFDVKDLLK